MAGERKPTTEGRARVLEINPDTQGYRNHYLRPFGGGRVACNRVVEYATRDYDEVTCRDCVRVLEASGGADRWRRQ